MIFKIEETSSMSAHRVPMLINAKSLRGAKIMATKKQAFYGTVLKIYDNNDLLLTYKAPNRPHTIEFWQDQIKP